MADELGAQQITSPSAMRTLGNNSPISRQSLRPIQQMISAQQPPSIPAAEEKKLRFPLLQGYEELDHLLNTMIDSEDLKALNLNLPADFKTAPEKKTR